MMSASTWATNGLVIIQKAGQAPIAVGSSARISKYPYFCSNMPRVLSMPEEYSRPQAAYCSSGARGSAVMVSTPPDNEKGFASMSFSPRPCQPGLV